MFLFKMKKNILSTVLFSIILYSKIYNYKKNSYIFGHLFLRTFFFLISPLFINVNIMSSDPKIILCRVEVMKSRALDNI